MWKFLKVPSAKEMGRSKSSSLPSRAWGAKSGEYTWEDWEEEARVTYPVRWKLRSFWDSVSGLSTRLGFRWDALLSRFWYKHHIIDLRRCGDSEYSGGYIDHSEAMVTAMFGILKSFVETYEIVGYVKNLEAQLSESTDGMTEHDLSVREFMRSSCEIKREMVDIYQWWTVDKPREEREVENIISGTENGKLSANERERRAAAYNRKSEEMEAKLEEMLTRLLRVRGALWD